jgi:hypothetical protein
MRVVPVAVFLAYPTILAVNQQFGPAFFREILSDDDLGWSSACPEPAPAF